ncbi:MAG TPA: ABC transporter ATP-binding protein [Dehalococcoidia bacterium]|nr:ABC transporter ATP-binding protein [Dehalococcoidia bacterium]|tara:strand:- start:420 stop:2285 length:1866 start_codon:yes stop_codon:yes gene_type:complete
MPLLTTSSIGITYGVDIIFSNINVEINERARIGIVGPNGGGKTSLLEILTGGLDPSAGSVKLARGMRVGYVPQAPEMTVSGSLKDEIMTAFDRLKWLEDAMETGARDLDQTNADDDDQVGERYAALLDEYESLGGYSYENTMDRMVEGLGLTQRALQTPAAHASGGERARVALAQALLGEPNLLILDEPTNHLDMKGLAWLERFLTHYPSAVVVVSHDRYFLDRTVNQVWDLDHGGIEHYVGNYSKFRTLKAERALTRQREYAKQQEFIAKEEDFIRRYHAGQRAREAKGRQTRLNRLERIDQVENDRAITLSSRTFQRSDQTVLRTHGLTVGYPDNDPPIELFSVPDMKLERGSRVALVGPNGTGKTTLLATLLGLLPPVSGRITLGRNVAVGYHRQGLDDLDLDTSVLDSMLDAKEMSFGEARSYLARFLFQGEDVFRQVGDCSGGERSRLALARLLVHEPNLLILDEPTTHLDIPSREALEQVLLAYEGTLLFVSHDRQFASLLAQELWVVEDGELQQFLGTFEEWLESDKEKAEEPAAPKKARPSRSRPQQEKKSPSPAADEHMIRIIDGLETRLLEIQLELEEASEQRDLELIASKGEEYDRTKMELDEKLAAWGG